MRTRAIVVRRLLDASVRIVPGLVVIGVVRVGSVVLLAVASVVHARSRTRPTLQVRIPGARSQMGRASSKVVRGREVGCDGLTARGGHAPSTGATGVGTVR